MHFVEMVVSDSMIVCFYNRSQWANGNNNNSLGDTVLYCASSEYTLFTIYNLLVAIYDSSTKFRADDFVLRETDSFVGRRLYNNR